MQFYCPSWDSEGHSFDDANAFAPFSWSSDAVVEDFEKGGFLKMMDELNQTMEVIPLLKQ